MHHVFEVDEILRFIASNIVYGDCEDAISFACCRKSFSESAPTLDTIWGIYQWDFTRLLQTLPPSVWTIVDGTFDFLREPSEEEWARLSVYARRMRCFMDPRHAYPSEAALKLLNTRFSGRCMLPKLRDIGWIGASPEQLELALQLIVSPILTDFRLGVSPRGPLNASQAIPALKALAPAYNSLVGIHICNSTIHDPHIIDAASTVLLKCNPEKLRYFHVDSALSVEAFTYATQLPNLESFFIRTEPTEFDVPPLPTSPVFPSLGSLEINANDTRSPFLQTIANLGLEFPAATLRTFLPTTITALRPRGLHQTLTRLSITPEGDFDLDMAALRPLLFLNQLTYLEITFLCSQDRCPHNLSDKNLEELVKAMPKLELLSLGPIPCAQPANSTLKSLVSIAKHCKHMQTLIIHTNVEAIVHEMLHHGEGGEGPPLEDPLSPFPACPLSSINFGPCFIPNDEQGATIFALTLLRLFPLLNSVTVFPPLRERCPLWELVGGAITTHRGIHVNIADAVADTAVN